jgi:hypothetical protein
MEILNKNAGFLTNFEVYSLLKQTKEDLANRLLARKKNINNNSAEINVDKHLPTIVYESLRYLEKRPCAQQSAEIVSNFLAKCNETDSRFKLTKVEKLQLINQRPVNAVELQSLIEDSEERFSIEQMDDLLEFVHRNLVTPNTDLNHMQEDAGGI